MNLKFKINNDSNTFKISAKNYQKIRNLNSIETLFDNKVKIKPLKIFNEENKNKIKNYSKYKLLNPKFGYINKTVNRKKINNIFKRKSAGKKRIVINLIPQDKKLLRNLYKS